MRSNIIPIMGAIKFLALAGCLALAQAEVKSWPTLDGSTREILAIDQRVVVLRCGTIGEVSKDLTFTWRKNGKPLEINHKTVMSPNTQRSTITIPPKSIYPDAEPEGTYHCMLETPAGIASSGPMIVKKGFLEAPKVEAKRHTPVEGEPFELDCPEVKAYPKPSIVWMYQLGSDPNISHTILDRRITTGPNGKLYFSNVTEEDTSDNFKYVCMASSPAVDKAVPLAAHYIIGVKKNPKTGFQPLVPQYVSKEVTAKAGDDTFLYCIFGGTPLAYPEWYYKGTDMENGPNDRVTSHNRSSGKRLLIRDTRVSDEGTYYCHVVDSQGKNTSNPINLKVVSAPTFVKKPEPKLLVAEGQDVTIPCQVQGVPKATITWTYNAQPLKSDSRVTTKPTDNASELQIKKIQKSDQGYYGCTATNENGVVYAESLVNIPSL
ncbi:hemolin-like isoform X1 [Pectinophora gossypiella]|uniref:hemolin-like isoform X1 n=1 Tax=Pectinophora gossypiella TaxID=13191 RepID=UPI00214E0BCD|nr:hemolin-like isoform X1 [Pectinophora gossypiella]